ncbi:hypothetical protein QNH46_07790 [Paenibacillus woosongensis]|uniref:Uncharacterized protein n=1 Tax=Paenibacillus woosongensis TaxID=307580 RepID=A0AA95IDQ4_9BACL|nr:hypothetical protein [Paenibacillus woosongensis]WHX50538.1 hypothetical protein QNH46_07790 [Paenibacillus woosongensis]
MMDKRAQRELYLEHNPDVAKNIKDIDAQALKQVESYPMTKQKTFFEGYKPQFHFQHKDTELPSYSEMLMRVAKANDRADKAERALREQTEETAHWICKYNGDVSRFQRQKKELAAAEERADKAEAERDTAIQAYKEAMKTVYRGVETILQYIPKEAREAHGFDSFLASLYPDKEREPNG